MPAQVTWAKFSRAGRPSPEVRVQLCLSVLACSGAQEISPHIGQVAARGPPGKPGGYAAAKPYTVAWYAGNRCEVAAHDGTLRVMGPMIVEASN